MVHLPSVHGSTTFGPIVRTRQKDRHACVALHLRQSKDSLSCAPCEKPSSLDEPTRCTRAGQNLGLFPPFLYIHPIFFNSLPIHPISTVIIVIIQNGWPAPPRAVDRICMRFVEDNKNVTKLRRK